ncbi:MAG TPA: response regulator transcription factor [Ktedonobacterales bacterium]|nr:response regulator transcription factor [Ktedonobacterales bacterium]
MTTGTPGQSGQHETSEAIRVLIVDDQMLLRQSFQRLLELEGGIAVVGVAGNGEEALTRIAELERGGALPDVVLMDIRMPVMDGVQATEQIGERWPSVRVLILTTFDDQEYVFRGIRAGAKGYLLKDSSAAELLDAIRVVYAGGSPLQPSVAAKLVAHLAQSDAATTPRSGASGAASTLLVGEELTDREREILGYIARGASNREIGEALFITEGTVKNHVSNILGKLALRDRTQAALWAREHGLG